MKILFIHNSFPAQFVHMARAFVQQGHEVAYVSEYVSPHTSVAGLPPIQVRIPPQEDESDKARQACLFGLQRANAFSNVFLALRKKGFEPHLIIDHPGWGSSHYIADIFPRAARVCYFEWYFTKSTHRVFTGDNYEDSPALFAVQRQRNSFLLNALQDADWALVPTQWQCRQLPTNFHYKSQILHDGIDTGFFRPASTPKGFAVHDAQGTPLVDIPAGSELLTFATRGLEPYRGFPHFYAALARILEARPLCQVVIMGDDQVRYGVKRSDGKRWGEYMRESNPLPPAQAARVHFVPFQPVEVYQQLLQASSVHVYLTVPFVLSWSLLEAMSCGCLVVASDTEPVREVVRHGINGFLSPWDDADVLADVIQQALEQAPHLHAMREAAREEIVQRYDLGTLLPQHLRIMEDVVSRKYGKPVHLL